MLHITVLCVFENAYTSVIHIPIKVWNRYTGYLQYAIKFIRPPCSNTLHVTCPQVQISFTID